MKDPNSLIIVEHKIFRLAFKIFRQTAGTRNKLHNDYKLSSDSAIKSCPKMNSIIAYSLSELTSAQFTCTLNSINELKKCVSYNYKPLGPILKAA